MNERAAFYLVHRMGGNLPTRIYHTLAAAQAEATRILLKLDCEVFILKTLEGYSRQRPEIQKFAIGEEHAPEIKKPYDHDESDLE